ncbi:MAG: hypothetical protein A4S09_07025 [Proteobacteria bacterium SG_bin7]|nr:MAG: hypothetical protein A4S09_07025 [Proteobacteria bacterium SG_bin7]
MKNVTKNQVHLSELTEDQKTKLTNQELAEIQKYNKAAADEQLKKYLSHPGHKMPVTRRGFLAAGIGNFAAYMTAPTIADMLFNAGIAHGQTLDCPKPVAGSAIPGILTINPTGGQGIQGIVVPLDKNQQKLASYSQHSMGTNPNTLQAFGALWNNDNPASGTFINQLNTAGITAANCKVVGIACRTGSDSDNNPNGIEGMATKAKFVGTLLPNLGRRNSVTGGGYLSANGNPPAPLVVNSFTNIRNALSIQGALAGMSVQQKEALLSTIGKFNERQIASLGSLNGVETLNKVLQCAGIQNIQINRQGSGGIDPVGNAAVAGIWGLNANSQLNSETYILGAMAFNAFSGQSGTSTFTKGGYDYHGNALANTRNQDITIMDYCAKAVRTAAALQRPAVILLRTDGSVSSNNSTTPSDWQGDRDDGMHLMILYSPSGVNVTKAQIGAFTTGQSVDLTVGAGDNQDRLAKIIMANILKFAGKSADINLITGLTPTDVNIIVA